MPLTLGLDRARLGIVNLELRFAWPLRPLGTAEYTAVPLITPRDADLISSTATLTPVGPLRVEPADDGNWLRDDDVISSTSLQAIGMASANRSNLLRVRVAQRRDERGEERPTSATVVERAWLQTWLGDEQRMDRAVFRFVTGAETVTLTMPEGATQVITLVDGNEVAPAMQDGAKLVVPLPRSELSAHTVEMSLTFAERPPTGEMQFQAPEILDALGPRRWFWQLLVPADEHLLAADTQLTSANRWTCRGWFCAREAAEPQARLEYWTGASHQPALPEGLNAYLFSSFDHIDHLRVRTSLRRNLVYGASAVTLGCGLALLYWPVLRHPAMLLILAVSLLSASWLFADAALLISQASVLGVLLVVLAGFVWLILHHLTKSAPEVHWQGRATSDSRSGVPSTWGDGTAPHSTISSPGPSVPTIVPDSKA